MHRFTSLFLMICLFDLILADKLKSCDVKHDGLEVCYLNKEGYKGPLFNSSRMTLKPTFTLRAVTEINENENSISIQADLWSYWKDPGLGLSNNSTE